MPPKLWIVFVVSCFLSAVSAQGVAEDYDYRDADEYDDDDDDGDKCPTIDLPPSIGGRCHVSDFCSKITCEANVNEKPATIIFQVNRCEKPLTATLTIKSPGFSVDWSHTFKDGDIIKLPADTGGLSSVAKFSVSLKVALKREGKKLRFKLELMGDADVPFLHSLDHPFDATLLEGEIPLSSKQCGFSAWYNKQPRYIKILMIAGPIMAFIFLFLLTVCCCRMCKRRAPERLQVKLPSHRPQISSTKSKVPMQQLVNEA